MYCTQFILPPAYSGERDRRALSGTMNGGTMVAFMINAGLVERVLGDGFVLDVMRVYTVFFFLRILACSVRCLSRLAGLFPPS